MKSNLREAIKTELNPMLAEIGLIRRQDGIFTADLGNEFVGWIGLPDAIVNGMVAVNPIVGLRHQLTQQMRCNFSGRKYHKYIPPQATISLGFLMPDNKWREWHMNQENVRESCVDLIENIKKYALPFFREGSDLNKFEAMFSSYKYSLIVDQREILPAVKVVRGDFDGAVEKVTEYCCKIADETDPRAEAYKMIFAPALLNYVEKNR